MPRWIKRVLVVIFAIAWTCVVAESYLRIFRPVPILPRYIQASSFGIRENSPDATYKHHTPEYVIELRTNSLGIRDDREFALASNPATARIVMLGDSFAIGYGVNYEDSVPAFLEARLADALKRPVEVINLGVSGYGTSEEMIMLDARGWQYEPDIVLVYWHAGDPDDNIRSNLFRIKDGKVVQTSDEYLPAVRVREFLFSFAAYRWIAEHSHFYNWIRTVAGRSTKELLQSIRASSYPKKPRVVDSDAVAPAVRLSLALLEDIQRKSNEHGAKMIILEIPRHPDRVTFKSSFPFDAARSMGLDFDVVSPIKEFQKHHGEKIYWEKSHGHWTPLGTSCVANAIAERIVSRGLLSPRNFVSEEKTVPSDSPAPNSPDE